MNESERRGRLAEEALRLEEVRNRMREYADQLRDQARSYPTYPTHWFQPEVPAPEHRDPDGQLVYTITTLEETP